MVLPRSVFRPGVAVLVMVLLLAGNAAPRTNDYDSSFGGR